MQASKYQFLLSTLIVALDSGKLEDLETGEVRLYARAGAISILLGRALRGAPDAARLSEADWKAINEEVAAMAHAPASQSLVGSKGIALLMSWALEGLQRHI